MKLWGGRFTKETNKLVENFNESLSFDNRFYKQDIRGSIAHVKMLAKQSILADEERDRIINGLLSIEKDIDNGVLKFDDGSEDIHSYIEAHLIERIGDTGKKLHTGRSRNDQVALDMKLYVRDEIDVLKDLLYELLGEVLRIMEENKSTYMPGFTHLQKAQPTTLAHHFGAYFEMFIRDYDRLCSTRKRMNLSPLGSGAFAGTTYDLDRDYLLELLADLSILSMHLSRLSEEIIIWNTDEYRFVEMDDTYSTGSSIMPQKKNPDIAELIRGKSGRVYGSLISLLTTMKGLPLAYNKDMQEDKEMSFDTIDTVKSLIKLMSGMLSSMKFNNEKMAGSAKGGFTNATDAADYLVKKNVAFRDAHEIVGRLVLYGIENKKALDDFSIEEFKKISEYFDQDIYEAISLKTCVEKRNTKGAPGLKAITEEIEASKRILESLR